MATRLNLMADQGSDFRTTILLEDAQGPIDLTTYTGRAQFRQHFTSARSHEMDVQLSNNGIVTLLLTADRSRGVRYGRYVYDVELTANNGVISRIAEGIITINPAVTRPPANTNPTVEPTIAFQFFGPDNKAYGDSALENGTTVLMNGGINTKVGINLLWQVYDSTTSSWNFVSPEGGFIQVDAGLEYNPSTAGISDQLVRMAAFNLNDELLAYSKTAKFYYAP